MSGLIENGLVLPVMEEFYSLQGEGYHTGKPAYFLRVGGCDVGCFFCDVKESWDARKHPVVKTDEVVARILDNPANAVVVTGGEPLKYNMAYFCNELHKHNTALFIETSGSEPLSGEWDWICLSPKKDAPPLPEILNLANELKVIVYNEADFQWAEENAAKVREDCMLYLQPEWSNAKQMMQRIVDYALAHPRWRVSIQSHKYMRIP
ncbi:7-carboxy-7-deazaguanine synthase QueE [Bacteroidales bacterium OttesenSCG-928-B11]|nr:7-carboxy-7-deazaguanine synthase QueE [Bacteroidales bacterium OttesenSCG-928-E04]MDL2309422.1 7-carboxy-7-deazaguanine synthase QueE [Bacteroidales bacterium OttesenSCG-928-C03]MDL2312508.1 7-carboxy-7-deazaguanine synthase QueE [Bacteroidales bacterium OttesenSCG-928-B11]